WLQRFTPRGPRSRWSQTNRGKAEALIKAGRMRQAGQAQVDAAKADGRWAAAYAGQKRATVPDDLAAALAADPEAKAFFETLNGANRYAILYRVQDAKKPQTRAARIAKFVEMCHKHETVH
ncbi:MAG TPA: YdeI/OmpD-associated family protein, partial [Pedococcus sp.]|nr:YdeI/OmpD-associated family protein [Pedococcus sp.]